MISWGGWMKLMPWVIDFLKPPPKWQIIKSSFAKVIAGQKKYLFTEISEVLSDLDDNFLLWCNRKCQLYFGLWTLVFLEKMDCNQITKCSVVGYSWRRRGWAFQMCVCVAGGDIKIWHDSAFLSFVWQLCSPKEEEGHFSSVSVGGMDGFIQGFNV